MDNYELLRYVVIGQYLPEESFLHRMDPAFKLAALAVVVFAVAFSGAYLQNALYLTLTLVVLRVGAVPVGYALSGLRPALWPLVFFVVLELLFYEPAAALHAHAWVAFGPVRVTALSVRVTVVGLMRVTEFVLLVSAYTLTTRTADVARAVERLLAPLGRLGVPARDIGLVFTIALRFVPTFALELERLMKAQASRGAGRRRAGAFAPLAQARALAPLVVPLVLLALRRAEDLAVAMESRLYIPSRARSVYRSHVPTASDWLALGLVVAVCAALTFVPMPA